MEPTGETVGTNPTEETFLPLVPGAQHARVLKELEFALRRVETAEERASKAEKDHADLLLSTGEWRLRRRVGYLVGAAAVVGISALGFCTIWSLPEALAFPDEMICVGDGCGALERYYWVTLLAHVLVTVALVWFGYQLLRASERLLIPASVVASAKDLTGVDDLPAATAAKMVEAVAGLRSVSRSQD